MKTILGSLVVIGLCLFATGEIYKSADKLETTKPVVVSRWKA